MLITSLTERQKKTSTYLGVSSSLQTAARAPSPCSLVILTILSTADKSEFHLVATGLTSLQLFSITSDAVVDFELLFHRLEHLANVDLDTRLYNGLTSA